MSSAYRELAARLEAKFEELRSRDPGSYSCRLGCHSCCVPGITVSAVEREALRAFLAAQPGAREKALLLRKERPHGDSRCCFLDREGACVVYPARPLVCRSHGAPLQLRPLDADDETLRLRDVCPLNFRDRDLAALRPDQLLNLDTINTLLGLLNRRDFPDDLSRTPLDALLKDPAPKNR